MPTNALLLDNACLSLYMRKVLFTIILGLIIVIPFACKHQLQDPLPNNGQDSGDSSRPCSPDTVYFEKDVLPVLRSNCAMSGCHDAASKKDGVILDNYENVMRTSKVKPGNPSDSELYEVFSKSGDDRMPPPPADPLSTAQQEMIRKWIAQGAKNLKCSDCDTSSYTYTDVIYSIILSECQGCHNGSNASGGYQLTNYEEVKAIALNGKLYGTVAQLPSFSPMPQGGKLQDCQIVQIKKWIDAGAPNN